MYTTTGISSGDGRNGHAALADGTLELDMATRGQRPRGRKPRAALRARLRGLLPQRAEGVGRPDAEGGRRLDRAATVASAATTSGFSLAVELTAAVPGLGEDEVRELLEAAHEICPYSKATRGNIPVTLAVG